MKTPLTIPTLVCVLAATLASALRGAEETRPALASSLVTRELTNRSYRLVLTLGEDGLARAILDDLLLGRRLADSPLLYRADRSDGDAIQTSRGLGQASIDLRGTSLVLRGRLGGLGLEHTFELPAGESFMEERVVLRNETGRTISLSDFEAGFQRLVTARDGQVLDELSRDRWVAVPLRARATDASGHVNDFSIRDLLSKPGYEPRVNKDQQYSQVPSRHRHSEAWAWVQGDGVLGIFSFNQSNMLFSVVSTNRSAEGTLLRFGGACMLSGEPAILTRLAPGQSADLGVIRYRSMKGGYVEAAYAYRAMLNEKGCRFPRNYNPPVHWEQLYDMTEAWVDRPRRYTKAIVEKEATKGRDYSCEALYLDPGWDTDFGTFLWGEQWLGPRRQFVEEMRSRYGLKLALHCPLATWMSHQYSWGLGAVKTWPEAATRIPPATSDEALARLRVPAVREGRRNLALLPTAKPKASSVFAKGTNPLHTVAHLNDGWFGNSASWITEQMPAWAEIDLGGPCEISEVRLGNDHAQQYTDRVSTDIRILAATVYNADSKGPEWRKVAESRGEPLQAEKVFRFAPCGARWVRVELVQGGPDMPRLDEIEIYEANPVSSEEAAAFTRSAQRGPKPQAGKEMLGPLLCLGSIQYREEAERRLLANCADGAVFLMYDGNWWNGGCVSTNHGHPVPYRIEDHTRANLDLAQRVHAKYPSVLIEMHDTIAGGSPARVTPVYYKYGLPGSYDENWGFELMWDPLSDLKEARGRSLYYYNLGCNVPIYLHIDLRKDNENCVVLWWFASTCRHLGIGGTSPKPAVVEAQKRAMKRYRELDRFYKRGEFYGLGEEIHVHALPGEGAFVVNAFNLSDRPRVIAGEVTLARLGLDAQRAYSSADALGTVRNGRYMLAMELPPWSARVAHFQPAGAETGAAARPPTPVTELAARAWLEQDRWGRVRGFNYQPSFGRTAVEIWIDRFDGAAVDRELGLGRRFFPEMNAVRLWLGPDAFFKDPERFARNFESALKSCERHKLSAIPTLFNNWHSVPDFGGVSQEMINYWFGAYGNNGQATNYVWRPYFEALFKKHASDRRILAWDMCNEPFNNGRELYVPWLRHTYQTAKKMGAQQPVAVSVAASLDDLRLVEPFSDVLMIHPYFAAQVPWDVLEAFAREKGKALLATECCWGALDDSRRVTIVKSDLETLCGRQIGFLAHALHESYTADLHRPRYGVISSAEYMAFIHMDGSLRAGHDIFNRFAAPPTNAPGAVFGVAAAWLQAKSTEMIRGCRRRTTSGIAAFPPQVGGGYEAFWLRDYAYMLEGNAPAFTGQELKDAYRFFLAGQRSDGAMVDCIKFDGTPCYMPGYGTMGRNPVADGSQFVVDVAWHTFQQTHDTNLVASTLGALVNGMRAVPRNPQTGLVHIKPGAEHDRCPYGFTDAIRKQGDELFCSLLWVQASRQLAELHKAAGRGEDGAQWQREAEQTARKIREVFWDSKLGLFRAATVVCNQPDIWGSAFAAYLGVATPEQAHATARYFQAHYRDIVKRGQIRHLPGGQHWEATVGVPHGTYQNGAYWATPVGWFVYTLDLADPALADQTVVDLARDFIATGDENECVNDGYANVSHYVASTALPLAGIRAMLARRSQHP